MGSETGVLDVPPEDVLYKERIYPAVCSCWTRTVRDSPDEALKAELASRRPYGDWLRENMATLDDLPEPTEVHGADFDTLARRQAAFGYRSKTCG